MQVPDNASFPKLSAPLFDALVVAAQQTRHSGIRTPSSSPTRCPLAVNGSALSKVASDPSTVSGEQPCADEWMMGWSRRVLRPRAVEQTLCCGQGLSTAEPTGRRRHGVLGRDGTRQLRGDEETAKQSDDHPHEDETTGQGGLLSRVVSLLLAVPALPV